MKSLEYFMDLPYRIEIEPIPANKGGGFEASIPQLGKYAVCADGETVEEALSKLHEVKKERLGAYLEEGLPIPEPVASEEEYSGKFLLRIPKYLHRELALGAKQNGVSLNQFITSLLSGGVQAQASCIARRDLQREDKPGHRRARGLFA
jgi:predicted HicB family RNase H-like nuclease